MLTPDFKPFRFGYSARDLARCAEREVGKRRIVYANRVNTGRMTREQADVEISKMEAIAAHFDELAKRERLL
jgi:hypothetical protein